MVNRNLGKYEKFYILNIFRNNSFNLLTINHTRYSIIQQFNRIVIVEKKSRQSLELIKTK